MLSLRCKPSLQGFKTNEMGQKVGYNTMIYSEPEVGLHKQPLSHPHRTVQRGYKLNI